MLALLHRLVSPFPGGYRSDHVEDAWPPGEAREVAPHVADYLLATFPDAFELASPVPAPAPSPVGLDLQGGAPEPSDLGAALALPTSELLPAIRGGVYDPYLAALAELEAGRRRTVSEALAARALRLVRDAQAVLDRELGTAEAPDAVSAPGGPPGTSDGGG